MGTQWNGRPIGTHGNLAAFSFYATKNVTTAEGGALATDNPCVAGEVERLALHGLSLGAWQRYGDAGFRHFEVASPGIKANMTDLPPSIGLHQLPRLEGWTARRAELAARYDALLADLPLQTPPPADPRARHAWHLYSVLVRGRRRACAATRCSTACSAGASAPACTTAACTCTRTTRRPYGLERRHAPGRDRHLRPHAEPPAQPEHDRRRPGRRRRGAATTCSRAGPRSCRERHEHHRRARRADRRDDLARRPSRACAGPRSCGWGRRSWRSRRWSSSPT